MFLIPYLFPRRSIRQAFLSDGDFPSASGNYLTEGGQQTRLEPLPHGYPLGFSADDSASSSYWAGYVITQLDWKEDVCAERGASLGVTYRYARAFN